MLSSAGITELLIDWSAGDRRAQEQLFYLVEKELRRLARQYMKRLDPGNTLQTTGLINETYIRLVDQTRVEWQNRAHFFAISATMMRRILLNYIREQNCQKRRGRRDYSISLEDAADVSDEKSREILALEDALCCLAEFDERKAKVVELRYYGGLSVEETAEVLKVSVPTILRDWNLAKAWLARAIRNGK